MCPDGIIETIHKVILALHSIPLGFALDEDFDIAAVFLVVVCGSSCPTRRGVVESREKVAEHIEVAVASIFVGHISFELLARLTESIVSLSHFIL